MAPTASKNDAFLFKSSAGFMEQLNDGLQPCCVCRSAVQADVRKRMSPPSRQDVPQISKELDIHRSTLYKWRSNWRLQGEVVPAYEKTPDSWSAADKFTVVVGTTGGEIRADLVHLTKSCDSG